MGYESRLFIVHRIKDVDGNGETLFSYGEIIADVKMCCVGYNFPAIFTEPIDFDFFIGEELVTEDKYGEPLRMTEIPTVIDWIERRIAEGENYRRLKPLLGLLKGFEPENWNTRKETAQSEWSENLKVIHYGY